MKIPDRVVFGLASDGASTVVILGVPTEAWEYMKDGKTHNFDLTKVGVPIKVILFGSKDQVGARAVLEQHNARCGSSAPADATGVDFSIPGDPGVLLTPAERAAVMLAARQLVGTPETIAALKSAAAKVAG